MEPEFDKVIDALLRSSPQREPGGSAPEFHPDPEEISAFAENALPAAARTLYITHFADCGRCRELLAGVIAMNAEDAPKAAAADEATTAVAEPVPWYRWLFTTPGLAAAMGVLVLVFSGFIGYIALQSSGSDRLAEISQADEQMPAASGPMEPATGSLETDAANASSNSAAAMSNTAAAANVADAGKATANTAITAPNGRGSSSLGGANRPVATDGVTVAATEAKSETLAAAAPAPPPAVMAEAKPSRDDELRNPAAADVQAQQNQQQIQNQSLPNARSGPVQTVPRTRSVELAKRKAAEPAGERTVGGKNFERRDGVWYDRSYAGQRTTNIRRGTEQYRKLDAALREITDQLPGVVVVVWRQAAYRIQ